MQFKFRKRRHFQIATTVQQKHVKTNMEVLGLSLFPFRKKLAGTSSWPSWISHFTGSFVGHSPSEMLCPPAIIRSFTSFQMVHTHTHKKKNAPTKEIAQHGIRKLSHRTKKRERVVLRSVCWLLCFRNIKFVFNVALLRLMFFVGGSGGNLGFNLTGYVVIG